MKGEFNESAPRMVFVPSHRVQYLDAERLRHDGCTGKLAGKTDADIEREYTFLFPVDGQTIAFTGWENLPKGLAKETRELLSQVMDDEDCALHTPMPAMKKLSFRPAARTI